MRPVIIGPIGTWGAMSVAMMLAMSVLALAMGKATQWEHEGKRPACVCADGGAP